MKAVVCRQYDRPTQRRFPVTAIRPRANTAGLWQRSCRAFTVLQDAPSYTWMVRREATSDGVLDADGSWAGGGESPAADEGHVEMPHAVMTEVVQDAVQGV